LDYIDGENSEELERVHNKDWYKEQLEGEVGKTTSVITTDRDGK